MNLEAIKNHLLTTLLLMEQQPEVVGLNPEVWAKANSYDTKIVKTIMNELEASNIVEGI